MISPALLVYLLSWVYIVLEDPRGHRYRTRWIATRMSGTSVLDVRNHFRIDPYMLQLQMYGLWSVFKQAVGVLDALRDRAVVHNADLSP
ncbi:hypothetical protein A0H81_06685 [Grifola frondosa]|uniref:Uncharacterized protein n=1 Tax=Grifola frondosa TaxID=5627 RepID=A0A1C7M868_GRIFR|nr:hypothetical protein A0H81_06685 [Grifola frondosa]